MSDFNPSGMTISQLVDRFAENRIAQDKVIDKAGILDESEIEEFTRLYWQMDAINEELKARGEEARLALLKLYRHPNMQVRLAAAVRTLAVAPVAARHELEPIINSRHFSQAGDAGMTLSSLDDGSFKPT